jgi:hypothetical protein
MIDGPAPAKPGRTAFLFPRHDETGGKVPGRAAAVDLKKIKLHFLTRLLQRVDGAS